MGNKWPLHELELVGKCPFCSSLRRKIAYKDVEDWSFYSATGKWVYWNCEDCEALYLDERPTQGSIGRAYGQYYTHVQSCSLIKNIKEILRNEINSQRLNINLRPRLHLPKLFSLLLTPLHKKIQLPMAFGLRELISPSKKGTLIDVGCGDGRMVHLTSLLGWDAYGIEIDPAAVQKAKQQGLKIYEGGYQELKKHKLSFDRVICSHVIEHVHDPLEMINCIKDALKPGGILILSSPNSTSAMRDYFGQNWRGLEAPRHLAIPSAKSLKKLIENLDFKVYQHINHGYPTVLESIRIERRSKTVNRLDRIKANKIIKHFKRQNERDVDFIEFVCIKNE